MRWTSMLAIYILFWAFSVFLVLPFGVRTTHEAGGDYVPGQAESAPHEFNVAAHRAPRDDRRDDPVRAVLRQLRLRLDHAEDARPVRTRLD